MTLAEELCSKYALTSYRARGTSMVLLAVNEALEAAAEIADQEGSPVAASRIRSLKWLHRAIALARVPQIVPLTKVA